MYEQEPIKMHMQHMNLTLCSFALPPAAIVRVRPAYAGEGRYFVRVPPGWSLYTRTAGACTTGA